MIFRGLFWTCQQNRKKLLSEDTRRPHSTPRALHPAGAGGAMSRGGASRVSRVALASALILALGASGARALERPDDPDPVAVPRLISVEGPAAAPGAAPTPPSGASLMAAVNEYVAARIDDADDLDDDDRYAADDAASSSSPPVTLAEKLSACGVGFADTDALRAVACPDSPSDPDAYDWSAYAAAYAAAPTDFPDSFLTPPPLDSCAAGCLPQAIDNATSIQRIGKYILIIARAIRLTSCFIHSRRPALAREVLHGTGHARRARRRAHGRRRATRHRPRKRVLL